MSGASLKIFHCADLHLGLRYSRYPAEIAEALREARFTSLEKMVEAANQAGCDLFLVAGDLFDTLKVAQRDVQRAAKILARFEKVVAVLPGNHDYFAAEAEDFWKHWERPEHGRFLLLNESQAYSLHSFGIDAVLYAAPCGAKYSSTHGLAWLEGAERPEATFHVGVAHGSFEGLSPDMQGNYFPMKAEDLLRCRLQLWLLGHIHLQYPPRPGVSDRIFYSGTHEPDGFDCRHEGKSWILELAGDQSLRATSLSTGQYRFRELELELRTLAPFEQWLEEHRREASRTLLKLTLKGTLRREEQERFSQLIEDCQKAFFYVKSDFSQLTPALSLEEISQIYTPGSFPQRLLGELARDEADREALQEALALLEEAKGAQA